ncbi:sodium/glutamate symporter [Variovorax saccharolyticus]|uniref:sodium/glutamate symporter n=1 Tax=Variovorax saccharolyticus TaxID=3053516 RepID=UPI002577EC4B|nr:sodium/glutamate symporter [Variovorax sp. J22R187]MDM0021468.1 sodium/glutamate symporter [Variovorax sp. J22R187]
MDLSLGVPATLAIAALVLVVGRELVKRIGFLRKYSIPEPVAGGLVAALLVAALQAAGVRIGFDSSLQPGLMLAFFATIGLGADARMVAKGGGALLRFTVCVIGMLVLENVIGVGVAKALGIDPLIGLIAGSVTMAGGHGTGAAWGQRFAEQFGLVEGPALALASATFGLIMGGVIGGPVAMRLIRRLQARGEALGVAAEEALTHDEAEAVEPFTPERLTVTIMLVAASVAAGTALARMTENPVFTLPTFVWTLFVGALLRNLLSLARLHEIDGQALSFTGIVALSLFLAMALMSLRLWELASLALPMLVILALNAVGVALYTSFVTFRIMGANYEAAVLVAGQCGFGLGATPTAIANLQAICSRYGAAPQAFILVPVVGAFVIDLCNAIVISGFVHIVALLR